MSIARPGLRHARTTASTRRPTFISSADDREPPVPPNPSSDSNSDDLKKPPEVDECNKPMDFGRRELSFWVTLFVIVAPLYLVTPLSWVYTLYTAQRLYISHQHGLPLSTTLVRWEWILFAYCVFESAFSIYYQSLCRYVRNYESRVPQRDMHELQLIFTRVLQSGLAPNLSPTDRPRPQSPAEPLVTLKYDDPRAIDYRNHFRLWFWGAPWRDITRESMRRWLSWAVFDKPLRTLDKIQRISVEEATIMMEKRAGAKLREEPEEGKDHIEPMGLTWDPVNVWSRPGILYVVAELLNRTCKWYLEWRYNMVEREYEGIGYLIRNPTPDQVPPQQSPLVLMHGLGFGVAQYLLSIFLLMEYYPTDRPVLIPVQPSISQMILHPSHVVPLSRDQWVFGLKLLFEKLGWDEEGVTMVSHSKGTLVHTWMLKAYPELIKRSCFVDPVCFCLWEGDLAWNFVYRPPKNAVQLIMKYFAATEPGIALSVQRHFDWAANALWFEEIPRARDPYYAAYFLGGKDAVIDGWRARRYLMNHGVSENLHWDPNGQHGQPVFDSKGLKALKAWLLAPEPKRTRQRPSDSGIDDCGSDTESSGWSASEDEVLDCVIPGRRRK